MAEVSPFEAGLRCACPQCGKGPLFSGYLRFREKCPACGADFRVADAGDGPAVFVILLVGAIVTPLLFILQFVVRMPSWIALSITLAATVGLCLALLPPFKALLFALQWRNKAREVRNEDVASGGA